MDDTELSREELERELETLPKGSVTYKRINGKDQPYLQWSEGGRTRSRYIKLAERDVVLAQVARRREIQTMLAGDVGPAVQPRGLSIDAFELNVSVGDSLVEMGKTVATWRHRSSYQALWEYLEGREPRVCALYGLRRTGKTTMLAQVVHDMTTEQRARTAYIKCRRADDMGRLNRDLRRLQALGYRYVLIDEITLLADFITDAAVLSDVFAAQGMRLVLSGTDSLSFWLARQDELYDRAVLLHTTFIPFAEHSRLLGTDDIDEYIAYGGTLRKGLTYGGKVDETLAFADDESARVYVDTAIVRNIQRSLSFYEDGGHYSQLSAIRDAGELTNAINRVIEDMNHRFVREVITRPFTSHDFGSAARNLRMASDPERRTSTLDYLDREVITAALARRLDILDARDLVLDVSPDDIALLERFLRQLDLVASCPVETIGSVETRGSRTIIAQPGMRYCQATALVEALMEDDAFAELSERERLTIENVICDDVRGRMLEDIVLLETSRMAPAHERVFKLQVGVDGAFGEFDMVIYDVDRDECQLFEVKHSAECYPEGQCRHLRNQDLLAACERRYGSVASRTVIYRGGPVTLDDGISYINAADYLRGLAS